ncbi:MAG: MFS transporter [Candidatus Omnitrophica bacterium]|nr:MFS transporter [Candidatus Omnitrophota bacterium]
MHRTIGYISKRFVQIQPGEGRKVLLTFLYFFLIITAYYVIKPVSRSLILGDLGSRMIPYMDLICAILMGPLVTLFARLVDRISKPRLVTYSFWTVTGILLLFWALLGGTFPVVTGAFYIWVAIFSVLVVTLFWLVANDLYHPREAKRLFGFIGSGGILGGIVGSSIAAMGAQVMGTRHLLLLSAGLLMLCWVVVEQLWRLAPVHEAAEPVARRHETFLAHPKAFAKLILQSRYLMLLIALVGLSKIVSTLVYYQFNPFIEQMFPDANARTTFTGMFFGGMNIAAFVIQFFFTSWILRRWGLPVALLALPIGLLAGTTTLLCLPVFLCAAGVELYDGSMNYSLQQTTKEVLYLPIDRSIRYKVKPFIDMVVFRFGKGIAAVIGILMLDWLHLPARVLGYLSVPLLIAWVVVAVWLRRDYIATIRTMLQARAQAKRRSTPTALLNEADAVGTVSSAELIELFGSLTDGQPSGKKLELLDRLMSGKRVPATQMKELLTELTAYEARLANPLELEAQIPQLKTVIGSQRESMAKRRQAIRLLARLPSQDTVDYLFGIILLEGDAVLREEAVKGLVKLRLHGVRFDFPAEAIRRQIAHERENYQRVIHVATVYRQHHPGALDADDPVLALLRVLMEESMEQIFRLLMLLYRPEDIHLIYEQLRAPEPFIRADAIELLDNLVDSSTRALLFPILDDDPLLFFSEQRSAQVHEPAAAYRVLQEAIWDHNCWLSVTTLCAVGHLQLSTMRQELEKASRQRTPILAMAAKVALHLSSLP